MSFYYINVKTIRKCKKIKTFHFQIWKNKLQIQLMNFHDMNAETIGEYKNVNIFSFSKSEKCTSPANEFLLHGIE